MVFKKFLDWLVDADHNSASQVHGSGYNSTSRIHGSGSSDLNNPFKGRTSVFKEEPMIYVESVEGKFIRDENSDVPIRIKLTLNTLPGFTFNTLGSDYLQDIESYDKNLYGIASFEGSSDYNPGKKVGKTNVRIEHTYEEGRKVHRSFDPIRGMVIKPDPLVSFSKRCFYYPSLDIDDSTLHRPYRFHDDLHYINSGIARLKSLMRDSQKLNVKKFESAEQDISLEIVLLSISQAYDRYKLFKEDKGGDVPFDKVIQARYEHYLHTMKGLYVIERGGEVLSEKEFKAGQESLRKHSGDVSFKNGLKFMIESYRTYFEKVVY